MRSRKKKISNKIALSKSEKVILVISYVFMGLLALLAILPVLHVVSKSFSSAAAVTAGQVIFWPIKPQFETMRYVIEETPFLNALKNSLIVTSVGTVVSMLVTIGTAYPLSKPNFKGRKIFIMAYIVSMVFFGGIVPAYMVVRTLGIIDTYFALILPFFIVHFNMFVVKNYFEGLPESVEESARIDGASDIRILVSIVCPMSKPVLATVALWVIVGHWNDYLNSLLFLSSRHNYTLQLVLKELVLNAEASIHNISMSSDSSTSGAAALGQQMRNGVLVVSMIPMIILYPFVQRYFISGVMLGSVKG